MGSFHVGWYESIPVDAPKVRDPPADKAAGGGDGSKASAVANRCAALRKKMWWQMRVVKPAREAAAPERQPSDLALEKRLACGRSQSPRLCVCVILLFNDHLMYYH